MLTILSVCCLFISVRNRKKENGGENENKRWPQKVNEENVNFIIIWLFKKRGENYSKLQQALKLVILLSMYIKTLNN